MLPRSSRLPAIMRCRTRGLRATVRNRSSGGAPRMSLSNSACTSGGYGGSMGAMRGAGISDMVALQRLLSRVTFALNGAPPRAQTKHVLPISASALERGVRRLHHINEAHVRNDHY